VSFPYLLAPSRRVPLGRRYSPLPPAAAPPPPPAGMASPTEAPDWAALPFSAVEGIVAHTRSLPPHQHRSALSALRLVNRHWRSAIDDSIRSLTIPRAPPDRMAGMLRRWQHLEALTLTACGLDEAALQALGRCRRLQPLSICHSLSGVAARRLWQVLAALPALQSLSVEASDEGPSPVGLAALAACSSLTALELIDFHREVSCFAKGWHEGNRSCTTSPGPRCMFN